jgi:hypothetical protein
VHPPESHDSGLLPSRFTPVSSCLAKVSDSLLTLYGGPKRWAKVGTEAPGYASNSVKPL